MTAEEYLDKYKTQNGYGDYEVTEDDAREAVKIARKEEREKAIEVARIIIHPMSENDEQENRIMANFRKLLKI